MAEASENHAPLWGAASHLEDKLIAVTAVQVRHSAS